MQKFLSRLKVKFDVKKIALIAGIVILFFLVMDLNSRLNELNNLTSQRDNAATVVGNLKSTLQVLETSQAYAGSQGAVEEWAYGEGHMVRPGEKLVVPLPDGNATNVPVVAPTPTPQPVQNWEIWLALILGK